MPDIEITVKEIEWDNLTEAEKIRITTARRELSKQIGELVARKINELSVENSDFTESEEKQI